MDNPTPGNLPSLLAEFIRGSNVKRAKLELRWEGNDLTARFLEALREQGFVPATVDDVDVAAGERVPAFVIRDSHAYFGWVFWEKFTSARARKLFGSVVRNAKGDWAIQITPRMRHIVHVNTALKTEMDIDAPSGF